MKETVQRYDSYDDCMIKDKTGEYVLNEDYERLKEKYEQLKEIISAQKEYIELLVEELNEIIPIAHNHGWETTRFEKGKRLRSKILELTKLI